MLNKIGDELYFTANEGHSCLDILFVYISLLSGEKHSEFGD